MIDKSRQVQLKKLLSEAVLLLCRNGLPIDSPFSIEAMIGITLSEDEVFLVSFRETVAPCSAKESCEPLPTEHTGKISKYPSHLDRNTRKHASGRWTGNSAVVCETTRMENADDSDNHVMDDGGFGYGARLGSFRRSSVVVKSEVDYCVAESLSGFRTQNADLSYDNGELEMELKSELDDDYGCEGFEDIVDETESSVPVIDTTSVVSLCRKPVLPNSSCWLPPNRKGRTRRPTLQRSTGSWYSTSSSSDQRQKGSVYLQESAESLSSVEKILSAIYPPTDNQSLRCHVCGAELKCRRTLMEHIRGTHLAIHSYHCPDCGLGFKWRSSLKHHRARNCTLPSVLAAAYDCRPSVGGQREPVSWTDN